MRQERNPNVTLLARSFTFEPRSKDAAADMRLAQAGDIKARNRILALHFPLVVWVASKLRRSAMPLEDRISWGLVGMIDAVRKFDPERGLEFATYAIPLIRGQIQKKALDEGVVRVPRYQLARPRTVSGLDITRRAGFYAVDYEARDCLRRLPDLLGQLSARERAVLHLRFGEDRSLNDCRDSVGLSRERIRQIQEEALGKLRGLLTGDSA